MNTNRLHSEIIVLDNIDLGLGNLFDFLKENTIWDNSITSRKTASYGRPYNYSNIRYHYTGFPYHICILAEKVKNIVGFSPNNCLLNYYFKNDSKMGFHSDQIEILEANTGIAIFSIGSSRIMRFKSKMDNNIIIDVQLNSNSFFYMTQKVQNDWLHSILPDKENINSERISITFRKIKETIYSNNLGSTDL